MGCLGGGTSTTTTNPIYYGPYGTGTEKQGQANADAISKASQGAFGQAQSIGNNTAKQATVSSANPGFSNASSLYNSEISGNYLNGNPALTNQLNANQAAANRAAGDQTAQLKSSAQRAGMGFSTANQEAAQGAQAAQNANAMNTNAQAIASNYANERQIQNLAPQALNQNMANQLNLGQAGISALYSPLAAQANLNSGIYSGGNVATPDSTVVQKPGALDYASQILGML